MTLKPDPFVAGSAGRPDEKPVSIIPGGADTPTPAPPATLNDVEAWDRLWTVGRSWLSNEAHYDLMRILCETMEDRDLLRKAMKGKAKITRGSVGQDRVHPALRQLDTMDGKIARLLELAGFTPTKQKLVLGKAKGRLDEIRERKAAQK